MTDETQTSEVTAPAESPNSDGSEAQAPTPEPPVPAPEPPVSTPEAQVPAPEPQPAIPAPDFTHTSPGVQTIQEEVPSAAAQAAAERPELMVGGAFAAGFLIAQIFKRIAR